MLSVEDRKAIQDLYADYNFAIDAGDADSWLECFTSDGTFQRPTGCRHGAGRALRVVLRARYADEIARLDGRWRFRSHGITPLIEYRASGDGR